MDVQFMDAVSRPLTEDIDSIIDICEPLRKTFVSPTETCSNYSQIREYTEHAWQCLTKSETMIEGQLVDLDKSMTNLLVKKNKTELLKREKKQDMENLRTKKEGVENSLMCSKSALAKAEEKVELAKNEMKKHQGSMDAGCKLKEIGPIMLLIPGPGWIVGPIMMVEGERIYNEALKASSDAQSEKQHFESQKSNHSKKVSYYERIISRTQNEIRQTSKSLKKIEKMLEGGKKQLELTADIQQKVRTAVCLVNVLSGRVAVLEKQTRCVALWKPIINIMEDVMKAIVCIAENRLLFKDGLPNVKTLRENVGELLGLCSSSSYSENDVYY